MGVRYPGPVSKHNLVCPFVVMVLCPRLGPFLPRRWPLMPLVGTGPPRTEPKGGVGRNGWESVMAVDRFCRNAVGPPEWECEAMGSVVWVQCANLCRVYIKSIDSHARG